MFSSQAPIGTTQATSKTFYGQYIPTPEERTRNSLLMSESSNSLSFSIATFAPIQKCQELSIGNGKGIRPVLALEPLLSQQNLPREASPKAKKVGGRKGRGKSQNKGD